MAGTLGDEREIARDGDEVLLLRLWRQSPERTRGAMLLLLGSVCGVDEPEQVAEPIATPPEGKAVKVGGKTSGAMPGENPEKPVRDEDKPVMLAESPAPLLTARGKIRQRAEHSDKGVKRGPRAGRPGTVTAGATTSRTPAPRDTGTGTSHADPVWDSDDIFSDLD
jgi:hypothetical protein